MSGCRGAATPPAGPGCSRIIHPTARTRKGAGMHANLPRGLLLVAVALSFAGCASSPDIFRIEPLRPVAELRQEALAATPPAPRGDERPSDLVELVTLDPTIKLDIRYATDNNFLGEPLYTGARVPAAARRGGAGPRAPAARGAGLRPADPRRLPAVVRDEDVLGRHAARPDACFVADPAKGSRHNRGCAVDLTLYDLKTGKAVEMPSGYDELSDRALPGLPGRHVAAALAPRAAAPGDGGGRLHRLPERVVALRLPRLAVVRRAERHLREPRALTRRAR